MCVGACASVLDLERRQQEPGAEKPIFVMHHHLARHNLDLPNLSIRGFDCGHAPPSCLDIT